APAVQREEAKRNRAGMAWDKKCRDIRRQPSSEKKRSGIELAWREIREAILLMLKIVYNMYKILGSDLKTRKEQ
ncbi:MAG: hypothetical protein ACLSX5_06215, partial [Lachnospiraceae bacterium]